jgi:predicted nucleotidyltransferase
MIETRLHQALRAICRDLANEGASFALVGGLAVSARTEPRFTKDLDLAIAAAGDREAEAIVSSLRQRGYRIQALVEQEAIGRLATVRLVPPGEGTLFVDLLFASSGIEPEIVKAATPLALIEGLTVPVASLAHLIATKVLARDDVRRPQDRADLVALLAEAGPADLESAREALRTIQARGAHRGKDLLRAAP